ncbi:MAG: DUF2934 domain-containing protein [Sphingobium sp.]
MADDRDRQIRERAHALWEEEGKPHGKDLLHWDQATREIGGADEPQDQAEVQAEEAIEVIEEARTAKTAKAAKAPRSKKT